MTPDELAKAAGGWHGERQRRRVLEDVEDLVGEEAKLGIRKPLKPRGAAEDCRRHDAHHPLGSQHGCCDSESAVLRFASG